ncbi:MAG TPA: cytochrome c biogenesis protein ResB [Candidatus Saccharimonadales bacterium]|nr:cytochrome c biogenesis protein ResB [Candidatus Saccharimonadales bacterium]
MIQRTIKLFTSLRLTVVCLAFAVLLVFFGTLAQVNEGLYDAQNRWFRSLFVWWGPQGAGWKIPIFPGGYLLGTVLLLNLISAHIQRFKLTWKKLGINVTHAGIILLLIGQLSTDLLSRETQVRFAEGETKGFSESILRNELVFLTDASKQDQDEVISIPESFLKKDQEIRPEKLPFAVKVKEFHPNAELRQRGPMVDKGPPPATRGVGPNVVMTPRPETKDMDSRNFPTAVVELIGAQGSLGTWLISTVLNPQEIKIGDRSWRMAFRMERQYLPYTMQLLKTTHEVYPGTTKPKNFQSRVRIENPSRGENREVDIYMNNPLRYEGMTFYQHQMGRDEADANRGSSTLQVVKNPAWLTPYVGCAAVGGGMVIQFMMHLIGFVTKRRPK